MRRCSRCGKPGHYRPSCTGSGRAAYRSYADSIKANAEDRVFVDALRDFLGIKPLYGGTVSSKPSSFDVGELPARSA